MSVSDFRKSSAALLIGTATNALAIGGLTISSNSSPGPGWVLVATGSNSAIWRDGIAFGSNATDVGTVTTGGSSSSNSRSDHYHRGVGSISHASNTFYGAVTLQASATVAITSPAAGTLQFHAPGTAGGGGATTTGGARVRAVANVALSAGNVVYLTWDTEDYDTDGYWTVGSPTRFTIPPGKAGKYLLTAASFTTSNIGNGYCVFRLNGTTIIANGVVKDESGAGQATATTVYNLAAGDYVEFGIQVAAGSKNALDAGVVDPHFAIQLLAA